MTIPSNFVSNLKYIPITDAINEITSKKSKGSPKLFNITNEIKPSDLFCYLKARFGIPNGIQNILRSDDSDNLIHWDWTLKHKSGHITIQGMNFRTEILITGINNWSDNCLSNLVSQFKSDFTKYSKDMGIVRKSLENWVEFVNPYQRLRRSISRLKDELEKLNLEYNNSESNTNIFDIPVNDEDSIKELNIITNNFSKGFGFCFGIRSMLPILAESYVNLLLYILMKPEIKTDERLRENIFRQPIDVRIKSLGINCIGFSTNPDFSSEPCKKYNTLVNNRNDLLHGNIAINKLKFNEVFFEGKIPIFKEYRTMWQRSLGVEIKAVGLEEITNEISIVDNLILYLESCIDNRYLSDVQQTMDSYELGYNSKNNKTGVLFPPWLVDMKPIIKPKKKTNKSKG